MQTILKLLANDSIIRMNFTPALVPQQYSRLMGLVKVGGTRDQLQKLVEPWADSQGVKVTFETE